MELAGKVAFITGGTKGIGLGIAQSMMNQGILVAITGRDAASTQAVAAQLNQSHGDKSRALGVSSDVRSYESQQQAVALVIQEFGRIDYVIANAGLGYFASVEDLTIEQWKDTIDTNLSGPFYTLKATMEQLIANQGYYISISSLAGTNFFAAGAAYNASKFGLTGFTQAAMLDLRKHNVRATTIMPGSVATYFNNHVPNDEDGWKIQIEDLGQIVVDLLKIHPRTLPSKIEVRPTLPPSARK